MASDSLRLSYEILLNLLRHNGIFRVGEGTRTPLLKPDESFLLPCPVVGSCYMLMTSAGTKVALRTVVQLIHQR